MGDWTCAGLTARASPALVQCGLVIPERSRRVWRDKLSSLALTDSTCGNLASSRRVLGGGNRVVLRFVTFRTQRPGICRGLPTTAAGDRSSAVASLGLAHSLLLRADEPAPADRCRAAHARGRQPAAADQPSGRSGKSEAADPPPAAETPANAPARPTPKPSPAAAQADEAKPVRPAGRLIRVSLPITGTVDAQVKRAVERAIVELPREAGRPVVVFELVPTHSKFGEGTEFGRALDLARYLSSRELSVIKTVAFIPQSIKGHGVLVALACEEIVMAPDAEIGEAGIDEPAQEAIDPTVRSGYSQIADRRRTIPTAVAIGMLDRQVEVLKVETESSTEFVLSSDLPALERTHTIQSKQVLIPAGQMGVFSGRSARELGFVKYLAADPAALAKALGLPADCRRRRSFAGRRLAGRPRADPGTHQRRVSPNKPSD